MNETKDKRFSIANREALIGISLAIFNFIWWFGFAYGLGNKDPKDYNYILGFPSWFFYSCIIGFLLMLTLVIIVVKFFFTEVSLEEEGGES